MRTRSSASSRPRHSWSSTRAAARGRDRARGHAAGVLLLVEVDPERQLVGHAAVERHQAGVVGADEVDLADERVQAGADGGQHEPAPTERLAPRRLSRGAAAAPRAAGARRRAAERDDRRVGRRVGAGGRCTAGAGVRRRVWSQRPRAPRRRRAARRSSRPRAASSLARRLAVAEPEQDDGDVVLAAALVGGPTSASAASSSARRERRIEPELVVRDHARQAVGADQEDVAVAAGERVGVDLDVGLGPERARDDRALRVVLGRLGRDLAAALELRHQRVVAGELLELAVAQAVGAAVADVAEADLVAAHLGRGERRAHAAVGLVGHGQLVDAPVGLAQDARELRLGRLAGVATRPRRRSAAMRRGHLARLRAAHAVGDREERRVEHQRVLVDAALAAHVGAAHLLDDRAGLTPRTGIRCRRYGSRRPPSGAPRS